MGLKSVLAYFTEATHMYAKRTYFLIIAITSQLLLNAKGNAFLATNFIKFLRGGDVKARTSSSYRSHRDGDIHRNHSIAEYPTGFFALLSNPTTLNLNSSWCDLGYDHTEPGKFNLNNNQLYEVKSIKGFKMANLNFYSLKKYIDELRKIMAKTLFDIL